jgi:hypothetical protein
VHTPPSQQTPPPHAVPGEVWQCTVPVAAMQVTLPPQAVSPVHSTIAASAMARVVPRHESCVPHAIAQRFVAVQFVAAPHCVVPPSTPQVISH